MKKLIPLLLVTSVYGSYPEFDIPRQTNDFLLPDNIPAIVETRVCKIPTVHYYQDFETNLVSLGEVNIDPLVFKDAGFFKVTAEPVAETNSVDYALLGCTSMCNWMELDSITITNTTCTNTSIGLRFSEYTIVSSTESKSYRVALQYNIVEDTSYQYWHTWSSYNKQSFGVPDVIGIRTVWWATIAEWKSYTEVYYNTETDPTWVLWIAEDHPLGWFWSPVLVEVVTPESEEVL